MRGGGLEGGQPHALLGAAGPQAQGPQAPGQSSPREGFLCANYSAWSLTTISAMKVSESGRRASGGENVRKNSVAKNLEGGASRFRQAEPEGNGVQGPELSGGEGECVTLGSGEEAFLGGKSCAPEF